MRVPRAASTVPGGVTDRVRIAVATRQALPWLAMVGVPLAITAALTCDQWWALVPLSACAWWWAPRTWGWEWVSSTLFGVLGSGWATVGATALMTWPDHRVLISTLWSGSAFALAVIGAVHRHRARKGSM